ncbi:unnamed protein product [Sphagnum tenellum]
MDHGDRDQILTASKADQLHEQAASARAAAAHQNLQLQLAIGYSNDRPVIVDLRASSKLKRPWQNPQFNIKTIPAAAQPATSSQLFSHSYPAPANTTTFAGPPGKSSMNFRPS